MASVVYDGMGSGSSSMEDPPLSLTWPRDLTLPPLPCLCLILLQPGLAPSLLGFGTSVSFLTQFPFGCTVGCGFFLSAKDDSTGHLGLLCGFRAALGGHQCPYPTLSSERVAGPWLGFEPRPPDPFCAPSLLPGPSLLNGPFADVLSYLLGILLSGSWKG